MSHLFENPLLPAEERIDDLLSQMTLEEKVQALGTNPSVPRLGVVATDHVEGLHGVALGGASDWGQEFINPTTQFCQAYGLGETWDRELVRRVAEVEADECRAIFHRERGLNGGLVVFAPNADLGRDPRWGRTEECFGEDPFLTAALAVSVVKGLQGDHPKYWRCASLMKHFLANSNEDGRDSSSSNFDERLWREYYSYPFWRGVVEGGSRAYMSAYNAINGVPCHVHPMHKEIVVGEWGQDGIICTDGGAMRLLVSAHKAEPDEAHAVAAIVKTGLGQFLDKHRIGAREALAQGLMTEGDVDAVLRGNYRVMLRLGLLDDSGDVPYTSVPDLEPWNRPERHAFVREVTAKSAVLLKNEGLLPLGRELSRIAVIGPRAAEVIVDWYGGQPPYAVSPLEGIRNGFEGEVLFCDGRDLAEAKRIASMADMAVVCAGNNPLSGNEKGWGEIDMPSEGREAVDRQSIELAHEDLVRVVHAANPRTVLVLIASFPYAINWSQANVPSILHLTHSSQELGNALADLLFGRSNPGGKLTQTWPKSVDQLPPMMDYDIRNGRTYMYFRGEPLYPFGFGLSYTHFEISDLSTSAAALPADGSVTVSVNVRNSGDRVGDEVVQLYVRYPSSAVERPPLALKGFARVTVEPGKTQAVSIDLPASALAYWSVSTHAWVVERTTVELLVGNSSATLHLPTTLSVGA